MVILKLHACAFVYHFLFVLQYKAKVSDQVNLVEELPNQVVLVVHSLSRPRLSLLYSVDQEERNVRKYTLARVSVSVYTGAYIERCSK
ncbi:unnamed protein product [Prunus armeniaca]